MFIKQAYKAQHEFWRYLIGSVVIFIASLIGQVPFMVALFVNKDFNPFGDEAVILGLLEPNLNLFLLMISFVFALVGIYVAVHFIHSQKFKDIITSRFKIDWGRVLVGFIAVALVLVPLTLYDYYANPADYIWNFKPDKFVILLMIAVILIPIQTTVEELVFRGYLMQGFGIFSGSRFIALLATSLIFGLLHIANPEIAKMGYIVMVSYIGTGFFLGILTLMDEGIELAMGFHAGNNLLIALLVTADYTALQTHSLLKSIADPKVGMEVFIPVLVIYPLILLIFSRLYKWSNWKEKLFGKVTSPSLVDKSTEI
ncbi:CPBP family intramembrane metalloprotease [Gangjinia marincola]|uniref:CPBP family intramembrane metalloprotease n=1 Tax=Gangjinia marincola TaxID=578463 RepID=A0ABP3XWE1_9FLAO